MSVSKLQPSAGANDFNLNLTGYYTKITLNKEYSSGSYSITSGNNDTSLDIYAFNADGSSAGSTATKSFTATKGFNKLVVVGGQIGDVLGFSYKTTYATTSASSETGVAPVALSASPTSLPIVDATTTLSGYNFTNDINVKFIGTDSVERAAKSVVVGSTTSAVVTRPDVFPVSASPYSITMTSTTAPAPSGSTGNVLANAVTAGASPVWVTSATLPAYTKNASYSQTVQATDADAGSTITYSVVASTLPSGLSFNTGTATISGTPTVLTDGGITIRATDTGGNYVDRAFTISNVGASAPTWITGTTLASAETGISWTATVVATDDSGSTPTYSVVGSLPTGISFNTGTGIFTGAFSSGASGTQTLTIRATDANGSYTDRAFTTEVSLGGRWIHSAINGDPNQYPSGLSGNNTSQLILFDANGNKISIGYSGDTNTPNGNTHPMVIKYVGNTMAQSWAKIFKIADGTYGVASSGEVDINNNIYITGYTNISGTNQGYVAKISSSGTVLAVKLLTNSYNTNHPTYNGIKVSPDGTKIAIVHPMYGSGNSGQGQMLSYDILDSSSFAVLVSGQFYDTASTTNSLYPRAIAWKADNSFIYIAGYGTDATGSHRRWGAKVSATTNNSISWIRQYDSADRASNSQVVYWAALNSAETYFYIGGYDGVSPQNGATATKIDVASGNPVWHRRIEGGNDPFGTQVGSGLLAQGIAVDSSDNVYLSGHQSQSGGNVCYLAKITAAGALSWMYWYGSDPGTNPQVNNLAYRNSVYGSSVYAAGSGGRYVSASDYGQVMSTFAIPLTGGLSTTQQTYTVGTWTVKVKPATASFTTTVTASSNVNISTSSQASTVVYTTPSTATTVVNQTPTYVLRDLV